MERRVIWLALSLVSGAGVMPAWSQEKIYRCGNEYTNSAVLAKQRNCQVVEGGHVTVVHGGGGNASSKKSANDGKPPSSTRSVPVNAGEQKVRGNEARAILQAELQKAQDKLNVLKAEFNDGNPNKSALELRNPQVFNERLESLKANIARQESDVAGIQRELSRHTGG